MALTRYRVNLDDFLPDKSKVKLCGCGSEYYGNEKICPNCYEENRKAKAMLKKQVGLVDGTRELHRYLSVNKYFKNIRKDKLPVFVKKLEEMYPNRNLLKEFKDMDLWLEMHSSEGKYRSYDRFAMNWLRRAPR